MGWRMRLRHLLCGPSWHRGRDAYGASLKVCDTCLQPRGYVLDGDLIRTPLRQHVRGTPKVKVRRWALQSKVAPKNNVTPFERQSQR